MKHCCNAHVMQCMKFETQWSNTQPKNCTKTSLILKKPKVYQKSQKLGKTIWNAYERGRNQHTKWRKMIFRPKISWEWSLEREKCVWEVKRLKSVERDRGKVIWNREEPLYRNFIKLDQLRTIKSYRVLKRHVLAIEPAIKDLTRGFLNNEAQWIEVAIKEIESFSMDWSSYQELSRMR